MSSLHHQHDHDRDYEACLIENVENIKATTMSKESMKQCRTAHNISSSSLRRKSNVTLVSNPRYGNVLANFQEVILGTKLSVLFVAIPFAVLAQCYGFTKVSILYTILFACA